MEEKLDKIIELLEKQNSLLSRLAHQQTTNNSLIHQNTPTSHVGPNFDRFKNMPGAPSIPNMPNVPATGGMDVKKMIEEARAKAMAQIEEKAKDIPNEE